MRAIIMAGGKGKRLNIGVEKPLLKIRGRTILERTVAVLRDAGINEIFVAVTNATPKTKMKAKEMKIKIVQTPGKGYVKDIQHLMKKFKKFLVVSADLPFLNPKLIRNVLTKYREIKKPVSVVVLKEDYENMGFTPTTTIKGFVPIGVNIVARGEDYFHIIKGKETININTPKDLEVVMKGPQKQFDKVHLLRTLLILEKEKRIGRKELAKKLVLGEGSVRSVLKESMQKGFLESAVAKGHSLSKKGIKFVTKLRGFVLGPKIIDAKGLTVGNKDAAILVRGHANRVKLGINERDAAIKIGSLGVTVLVFKNNELKFPNQTELKVKNKDLCSLFEFKEGDALIIGTDNTYDKAENAAIAALFTLVEDKIVFS